MAGEPTSWDEVDLVILFESLRDFLKSAEVEEDLLDGPEDLAVLGDDAEQEYEDAFDRAIEAVRSAAGRAPRDHRLCRKAAALLDRPGPDQQFWRYKGWPLVTAYLDRSFASRHRSTREMLDYAERAHSLAKTIPTQDYPPGVVADLCARVCCEYANALRVNERYEKAGTVLAEAEGYLAAGSGDTGLSALACEVKASLRLAQRRLPEALTLLEEACRLYRSGGDLHLVGRTQVSHASVLYASGRAAEAAHLLQEALPLLDGDRDRAVVQGATSSLALCLADSGEYRQAGDLLLAAGLQEAFADQPLNLLRLRWVEAKIHAGLDRLDRAAAAFAEVRAGFLARGLYYDAALAGLDMAGVWLRQGRTQGLQRLLLQIRIVFRRLDLPTPEALVAITFLMHACRLGAATVRTVQQTRDFLFRCQADPALRFDAEAVYG